jgi:hypothetical protein
VVSQGERIMQLWRFDFTCHHETSSLQDTDKSFPKKCIRIKEERVDLIEHFFSPLLITTARQRETAS